MLNHQEALAAVEREIAKLDALPNGDLWAIHQELTIERPFGWIFFYGSKLYAETGESQYVVAGNAPFLVNRNTGEIVPSGTARPVEFYITEYETRLAQPRA